MKTKILRVISFVMAIAMAFSLASCTSSCKKKKSGKKAKKTASVVSSESSQYTSSVSSEDPDDYDDNGDVDSEPEYHIIIARPEKDDDMNGGIATGEQLKYNDGEDDSDDPDEPDEPDVDPIDEDEYEAPNVEECSSPLNKYGSPLKSGTAKGKRTMTVNNDEVTFKHFDGVSTNVFPTYSTLRM